MYTANLKYPSVQSVFSDLEVAEDFTTQAWALPCWQLLPYRSVQVALPDGSSFWLSAPDLAAKAARALRVPGTAALTHLVKQVIPMMETCPEVLLELAHRLTWREAQDLARGAFWRSPTAALERQYKTLASMSLNQQLVH